MRAVVYCLVTFINEVGEVCVLTGVCLSVCLCTVYLKKLLTGLKKITWKGGHCAKEDVIIAGLIYSWIWIQDQFFDHISNITKEGVCRHVGR